MDASSTSLGAKACCLPVGLAEPLDGSGGCLLTPPKASKNVSASCRSPVETGTVVPAATCSFRRMACRITYPVLLFRSVNAKRRWPSQFLSDAVCGREAWVYLQAASPFSPRLHPTPEGRRGRRARQCLSMTSSGGSNSAVSLRALLPGVFLPTLLFEIVVGAIMPMIAVSTTNLGGSLSTAVNSRSNSLIVAEKLSLPSQAWMLDWQIGAPPGWSVVDLARSDRVPVATLATCVVALSVRDPATDLPALNTLGLSRGTAHRGE